MKVNRANRAAEMHFKGVRLALVGALLFSGISTVAVSSASAATNCRPRPSANLSGCDYRYRNLTGANFSHSNLTGARFAHANLTRANFAFANLNSVTSGALRGTPSRLPGGFRVAGGYLVGPGANLAYANLARLNLSRASLRAANLTHANLTLTNLGNADLRTANLTSAIVTHARLGGALLSGARPLRLIGLATAVPVGWVQRGTVLLGPGVDLSHADLRAVSLDQVGIPGANLSYSLLTNVLAGESDFRNVSFAHATMAGIRGQTAVFAGANLTGTNMAGARLQGANLTNVAFSGANLTGAFLAGAAMGGAKLTSATLTGVSSGTITGTPTALPPGWRMVAGYLVGDRASLMGASLGGASLAGASLRSANLTGAALDGADLHGAALDSANLSGAGLSAANLATSRLVSVDLSGANLTGANLASVISSGIVGTPAQLPGNVTLAGGTLVTHPSALLDGQILHQGEYLASSNGAFTVRMQTDGNLVEYQGGTAVWATGTSGPDYFIEQGDCNGVIYDSTVAPSAATAKYTTASAGNGAGCAFSVADDGTLTAKTASGTVLWARYPTGTLFTHRIQMAQNAGVYNGTDTSSGQIDTIPTGASPNYVCWTTGQVITGVDVWFYVSWNGKAGYYASYYDNSHYSYDARISIDYGVPKCGTVPTTFTPPSTGASNTPPPATIAAAIAVTSAVAMRPGPSTGSGAPVATLPAGASPGFFCWTTGENVGGVDVWFEVYWQGVTGYYPSYNDNSHYPTDSAITSKYGIPACPGTSTGGGGTTGSAGASATEQAAANWARAQVGSGAWKYLCLSFVYAAWQNAGVSRATLDALAGYSPTNSTYPIDEWNYWASGHAPQGQWHQGWDPAPPAGAIIYWSNKLGHDYSHATVSLGGGAQISPDTTGVIGPVTLTYQSYRTMLGWWLPQ